MDPLVSLARDYLQQLCVAIPTRAVGSDGNRRATDWFAETIAASGFTVETPSFDCMDWSQDGAELTIGGQRYAAQPSPYALGCDVTEPLIVIDSVEALAQADIADRVVLLRGPIAASQLMPKNFAFYNPEEHQRIYALLEAGRPAALICATGRDPNMAGALYPFPLFEDGDFDIPSIYLTDVEGDAIAAHAGAPAHLVSRTERRPARASNVIARLERDPQSRIVVMAHIDAKTGTPGALDDGGGIVTLLLLARLLAGWQGRHTLEIAAINGEDYYSAPGEMEYLRRNEGQFGSIALGINLDGIGYIDGATAYSFYECPPDLEAEARAALAAFPGLSVGEPWYQGDHMMLIMQGCPALALTSERVMTLMTDIVHTENDTVAIVDPARLAEAAQALQAVITRLDRLPID